MSAAPSVLADPLSAEAILDGFRALQPELVFLLEDTGVADEVRAKIGSLGYVPLAVFARVGDSAADVRSFCTNDLGIAAGPSAVHN